MRPVLLIIDMQQKYYDKLPQSRNMMDRAVEYINFYSNLFRSKKLPVINIYAQEQQSSFIPGAEGFEFMSSIHIESTDHRILKNHGNSFKKTELKKLLDELGVDTVFLCGLAGEYCVHATYYGALDLDFNAYYVPSAIAYVHPDFENVVSAMVDTIGIKALVQMIELACPDE